MNKGMSLEALLTEVQRQTDAKKDYVASTEKDIRIVPMEDFPQGVAAVLQKDQSAEGNANPLERLEITEHAHRQIADRLKINWKFYHRMLSDHTDIVLDTVNKLFERESQSRMLRTMDGKLRAFLSNRYRRIDNDQVLGAALPPIVKGELDTTLLSSNVTDNRLYLKVLLNDPSLQQTIGLTRDGTEDVVKPGFILSNSEIGAGALDISAFFFRDFCYNGCVFGKTDAFNYRSSHLGGALIEGTDFEIMSDKSKKLEDETIMSQVTDVMTAIATPEFVNQMGDKLRSLAGSETIKQPVPALEVLSKEFGLKETESASALQNLMEDRDYSQWGAVNAVTKLANSEDMDYDRACELEQVGSKIIDLTNAQWHRIASAQPEKVAA